MTPIPPELMQTELHHVRTLKIMGSVLRRAMLEELQLQPGAVNAVFPCVDELSALHQRFLAQLLQRRRLSLVGGSSKNFVIQRLGDVLVSQVWGGVLVWGGPGQAGGGASGTRGHDDEPNGVTGWHWETSWPPGEGTGVTVALRAALVSQGSTVR